MTIEKFLSLWANSGDTTPEPDSSKIDTGWVGKEKVRAEYWNWLQNRVEEKINNIISERFALYYTEGSDATNYETAITKDIWDEPWCTPEQSLNRIDIGASTKPSSLTVYIDDGSPYLLAAYTASSFSEAYIKLCDPRTMSVLSTSGDLLDDITGTISAIFITDIATDGTSVYVTMIDSTNNKSYIQAWDISTWDVKSGWPSGGTELSSGSSSVVHGLIWANDSTLAVDNSAVTVSASSSAAIRLIDPSDGSISSSGAGDCPTGVSASATDGTICSDGTYIYFSANDGSNSYVCSAAISDLTTGCGGSNYPLTWPTSNSSCAKMLHVGGGQIVSFWNRSSGFAATDEIIGTHNSSDADLCQILRGQNTASTPLGGDKYLIRTFWGVCFDGLNIWMFGQIDNLASLYQLVLIKLDVSKLSWFDTSNLPHLDDLQPSPFIASSSVTSASYSNRVMAFDGRDLWYTPSSSSQYVLRMPLAPLRS